MVVKKVRSPRSSSSLGIRIGRLADYIDAPETPGKPERVEAREKCIYSGARGFFMTTFAARKLEMQALARETVHSRNPIGHYVLSWREDEQPTPEQVEEAVDLFLDELNLSAHQVFYGLHVDTEHVHLHLMINRVHPTTLKVIESNQGFDLEAAHRAVARIEHAQGWRREARGRYRVQEDGAVQRERCAARQEPRDGGKRPAGHPCPRRCPPAEQRPRARLTPADGCARAEPLQPYDLGAFIAVGYGRRVDYRRRDSARQRPGLVDRGAEIVVYAERDRETVRAALHLATQKWGAFQVEGDAAYQALCRRLAAEYAFPLRAPVPPAREEYARSPGGAPPCAPGGVSRRG